MLFPKMMEGINTLIILEIAWDVISSVKCHLIKWGRSVERLTCAALLEWCGTSQSQDNLSVWLLMDSSLPLVVKSTCYFLYYLVRMQVLYFSKLWHSWCDGVSRLWHVSHQRWFDYLKKLLFYLSWLYLAYFMELTAGFLPPLTFCFSTDFLSVPWSVLFPCQELITAFNLISLRV